MTEQELRQQMVRAARGWLGCRESDGSHRPIVDLYNRIRPLPQGYRLRYTDPWCAAFVSALGEQCGLGAVVLPECSCERMIALYRAAGRFEEQDWAVPRVGDLVMYDWDDGGDGDCRGAADHVGLIVSVTGDLMKVIEGNKSDAVGERTLPLDSRFIRGYCQPDYAALADEAPRPAEAEEPSERDETGEPAVPGTDAEKAPAAASEEPGGAPIHLIPLPELKRGDGGEAVRAAQLLLIGRGYRCGPWGADGDFGPATCGAVCRFQRARQLAVDGVVGPETWEELAVFGS